MGVHGVGLLVHRDLRWKFREQHESDVGIDALVEVVDGRHPTGRHLALQIKSGPSWFAEPTRSPKGWVYRGSRRHLDYWLGHDRPVLLVLYDHALAVGYWQHVNAATAEPTGAGFKMVVPADNRLDGSARQPLRELVEPWPRHEQGHPFVGRPAAGRRDEAWDWLVGTAPDLPRVKEADRAAVGIHPAIALPTDADPLLPADLPSYVARDIDRELRAAVAAATRAGGFVVLVGAAAAGKTRSAFEAVKAVVPEWRMLIPDSAADLTDLVVSGPRLDRTVVWLDELETYLRDGLTARLVRRLRADPDQPLLIIGTMSADAFDHLLARPTVDEARMTRDAHRPVAPVARADEPESDEAVWPQELARAYGQPVAGAPDTAQDARRVLSLVTHRIWVPDATSPDERTRAEAIAGTDPRIAEALGYRPDLGLPAVLAVAPETIQLLRHRDPAFAREVLVAAVQARICGHPEPIPGELLHELAAAVVLTDPQRARASEDWFPAALANACRPVRGVAPPLWPCARRVGKIDGYAVSDMLVQYLSQPASELDYETRHYAEQISEVRYYLAEYADPVVCRQIGTTALQAGDLLAARVALERAAAAGDHEAMNNFGVTLNKLGEGDAAALWYQVAADVGNTSAMYNLGLVAERDGDIDRARDRYQQAAAGGHDVAMFTLGSLASDAGDLDAARRWYQAAVDAGNTDAINNLAVVLDTQGNRDAAQVWYRRAIEAGSVGAMLNLGNLLTELGDRTAATNWWTQAAEAGNTSAMFNLGNHLVQAGDRDAGVPWLRRAAEQGHLAAANNLAVELKAHGNVAEARRWWEQAAGAGDTRAMNNLGNLLEEHGEVDAARRWYEQALQLGAPRAKYHLAEMAARRGDLQPLRTWFLEAVDADTADALALGYLLAQLGDLGTLRRGLDRAFQISNTMAVNIGTVLATHGDLATIRQTFQAAADADDKLPMGLIAPRLAAIGALDVVRAWFEQALTADDLVLIAFLGSVLYAEGDQATVERAVTGLRESGKAETAQQLRYVTQAVSEMQKSGASLKQPGR